MDKIILSLKNMTKKFGGLTAVDNVSFDVKQNEIFGLIGPNGAGKTTIFNIITSIYKLTDGEIYFSNDNLQKYKPFEIANLGITRTFQNIRLFKDLTTYNNVLTACHKLSNYKLWDSILRTKKFKNDEEILHDKAKSLLEIMGLWDYKDVIASNLPYGLQRKLEIARALALKPKLLLLDEPAAGMNPEETIQLIQLIKEIRDKFSLTVIVIEHHMDLIMGVCDRIYVLNFGHFLAEGSPEDIQKNKSVIEAYLGREEKNA